MYQEIKGSSLDILSQEDDIQIKWLSNEDSTYSTGKEKFTTKDICWLYYKGKAPSKVYKELPFDLKLTTKEEINMFIESDEDICKLQYKIDYIEQIISFLEGVLRQIGNRNFQIKNAIGWEKFKNGF